MLTPGYEFVRALLKFHGDVIISGKYEIAFATTYRQAPFLAQEEFAQLAVDSGSDYLLIMDDDIWNPSLKFLDILVASEKEVVGGVFFSSADPGNLCAKRLIDDRRSLVDLVTKNNNDIFAMYAVPPDEWHGLQRVHLISLGFVLIKTKVFNKLRRPWFSQSLEKRFTDSVFCDNCKKSGVDVYAHFDVMLNHRGITLDTFKHWAEIYKIQKAEDWKPAYPLSEKEAVKHINVINSRVKKAQKKFIRAKVEQLTFYDNPNPKGEECND